MGADHSDPTYTARTRASGILALVLCSVVAGWLAKVAIDGEGEWEAFLVLTAPPTALFLANAVAAVARPTDWAARLLFGFWSLTLCADLWLLQDLAGLPDRDAARIAVAPMVATAVISVIGLALCVRLRRVSIDE